MNATTVPGPVRRFAAALSHVLIHAAAGMLIAALLGWLEVDQMNRTSVNEFNGIALVIAVTFTGPVACALAAPLHLACHVKAATPQRRHLVSIVISTAAYVLLWLALHVT